MKKYVLFAMILSFLSLPCFASVQEPIIEFERYTTEELMAKTYRTFAAEAFSHRNDLHALNLYRAGFFILFLGYMKTYYDTMNEFLSSPQSSNTNRDLKTLSKLVLSRYSPFYEFGQLKLLNVEIIFPKEHIALRNLLKDYCISSALQGEFYSDLNSRADICLERIQKAIIYISNEIAPVTLSKVLNYVSTLMNEKAQIPGYEYVEDLAKWKKHKIALRNKLSEETYEFVRPFFEILDIIMVGREDDAFLLATLFGQAGMSNVPWLPQEILLSILSKYCTLDDRATCKKMFKKSKYKSFTKRYKK